MPPDDQHRLSPRQDFEDHPQVNEHAPPDLMIQRKVTPDSANHVGLSASSQHKHVNMGMTPENK